jgi:hypothetical protein
MDLLPSSGLPCEPMHPVAALFPLQCQENYMLPDAVSIVFMEFG